MGEYTRIKANTHLPATKENMKILSAIYSGFTGNISSIEYYDNPSSDLFGNILSFPFPNQINCFVENGEIVMSASVKYVDYETTRKNPVSSITLVENISRYIGSCDVNIESDINDEKLSYRTADKENDMDLDSLREKLQEYDPWMINSDITVHCQMEKVDLLDFNDFDTYVKRMAEAGSNIERANIGALCFYSKKDDNFTQEDVLFYSKCRNNMTPTPITSVMRLEGLDKFFEREGLSDLAEYTRNLYNECKDLQIKKDAASAVATALNTTKVDDYEGKNKQTCYSVTKYDTSDFYHFKSDSEYESYPFGSESITFRIREADNFDYTYKCVNPKTNEVTEKKAKTLDEVLSYIQHPLLYEDIVTNIRNNFNKNPKLSQSPYVLIDSHTIDNLYTKLKDMQSELEVQRQAVRSELISDRVYLDVPFADKDEAKALGALWDVEAKSWYCVNGQESNFEKWLDDKDTDRDER